MSDSSPFSIMVVDDEPDLEILIRQKFRRQIREEHIRFYFAQNGQEALDQLQSDIDVDIVLTDINMPKMDGLSLLAHLPACNPIMKAIIVSAYGDMENIRTAMNRGAFDFITKPINFQDLEVTIEKTYHHVKQQKETLKAIRENNILKMYVDEDVIRFMSSKKFEHSLMASESVHASVLFIDIAGYTAISEKYPAEVVVRLLNSYFDIMVREIVHHKGQVDKFMGDCVMAVFRGEHHLEQALKAALAVRDVIASIVEHELDGYNPQLTIGVHSGEMISGNIGSESLRRLDYTVIGDVVNTAQRLQSAGRAGQIIIAQPMFEQINHLFQCESLGEVVFKNKTKPMHIYNVKA